MARLMPFLLLTLLLFPLQAFAVSSNWQHDGSVDVRLISSLDGVGQKTVVPLGLEVRMEPGWHTYWRSPGAAGLPPQFDWTNSLTDKGNLKSTTLFYPAPKRYSDQGLETVGYQGRVVFPIDAELRQVGLPLNLETTVNLLACSTLCVPKTFTLRLQVPAETAVEGPEADILNPARAQVPGEDGGAAGLSVTSITQNGPQISVEVTADHTMAAPDMFIESTPEIPFTAPQVVVAPDQRSATLTVKLADIKKTLSADMPLVFTIVDEGHSLEAHASLPPADGSDETHPMSFRGALLLAIVGGFLLNLMPCVLPVLSLKFLAVLGHGGGNTRTVRRSFMTTAAGILFSFLLLACMTLVLKSLGHTLGWGVQFQQPLFLIALILVLSVFAANMWGLFEIQLPLFVTKKLSDHHPKMASDFATGALATLLATPCTAPFLGTAVGFALASGSPQQIIAIFLSLGFGMVLPYFAIALFPQAATLLPQPGVWMVHLRRLLGFALALTAVWLLWVLSSQILAFYAVTVGVCMVGIVCLLGIHATGIAKCVVQVGLLVFAVIAVCLTIGGTHANGGKGNGAEMWRVFDQAEIARQVAAGHTVFVDITADWCLTCKANKKFVLSDDDISHRLFHSDVVPMQGDYTNPDPNITNFLHGFRRYGIPFDVVYGPGAPQGITLPELLTHDVVMNALARAEQ
jgi:suppressor for copper-sensitivity B